MNNTVKFKKLIGAAKIPTKGTANAVGYDAFASEQTSIPPKGGVGLVKTGLAVELPAHLELQVRPRSGLALKKKVSVLNTPGTIDPDYRGEIGVILINHGDSPLEVNVGDPIAQFVFNVIPLDVSFVETDSLSETGRGAGGYGHTSQQLFDKKATS